jgi:translation initiation factor IF-3
LVEVAPTARPPVCKIMDYGKWRYQQQKKEDKSRASSKGGRLKQLNIDTVRIGDHDLEIKVNRARGFLEEGNKVQFTLRFKGREMAHQDLGFALFRRVKTDLWQVSKIERDAKMEGRRMTLVLQPDHKPAGAKPPVPGAPAGIAPKGPMTAGSGLNIAKPPGGAADAVARPGVPAGVGPAVAPRPGVPVGVGPAVAPRPGVPAGAGPAGAPRPGVPAGAGPAGAPRPVAAPGNPAPRSAAPVPPTPRPAPAPSTVGPANR